MQHRLDHSPFLVPPGQKVKLKDYDTSYTANIKDKAHAKEALGEDVASLSEAQALLWASGQHAVLIILQALDAAGKDSTIKHVMSGVNPQGVDVYSFKAPNDEERSHHFLWRPMRYLPPRGRITIFNRSYYEEVLVVRVHPEFLDAQWLPEEQRKSKTDKLWPARYDEINAFEHNLTRNNIRILKFFLNVSKEEQCKRFLKRLTDPKKHWKYNSADVRERAYWDDYQMAYQDMLGATSTEWAPWYVIPADKKWFMRACVADIIVAQIEALKLQFPTVSDEARKELEEAKVKLMGEKE